MDAYRLSLMLMRHSLIRWGNSLGIVRVIGRELVDRRSSRLSRGESTPFCECSSAVLFEDFAAVEVTVEVEVIVDRGVGGGELLESFHVPELRHRSFSSSERLV